MFRLTCRYRPGQANRLPAFIAVRMAIVSAGGCADSELPTWLQIVFLIYAGGALAFFFWLMPMLIKWVAGKFGVVVQ